MAVIKRDFFFLFFFLPLLFLIFFPVGLNAQEQQDKSVRAIPISEKPRIDGRLNEPMYADVFPASDFIQFHPKNGEQATFSTEAYVFYTRHNLYIAFRCHDPEAAKIRADITPFGSFENNDEVEVLLDPFSDQRNLVVFTVNPRGVRSGEDTIWKAAAAVNDRGWCAEIEIPFKSLRFPIREQQEWRINFRRRIFRLNETDYWTHVLREQEAILSSTFGTLTGLQEVKGGRNIEIFPYSGVRSSRSGDIEENVYAYGLDMKYGVTSNLTLDLTSSPDYSDVESDPFFYQTDPYEYKLLERRPFYSEGSQYFTTAYNLFYSRRITNPELAAKLTGKERGYTLGLLMAKNERQAGDQFFGVLRVKKDILHLSEIGMIYSSLEQSSGWNRNLGFDFRFNLNSNYTFSVMAAYTFNQTQSNRNNGLYRLVFGKRVNTGFSYAAIFDRIEPNVAAPAGFINVVDYQKLWLLPRYHFRWEGSFLESLKLSTSLIRQQSISLKEETGLGAELIIDADFRNQMGVGIYYLVARERPRLLNASGNLNWYHQMLPYRGPSLSFEYSGSRIIQGGIYLMFLTGSVYSEDFDQVKEGPIRDHSAWLNLKLSPRWQWNMELIYSKRQAADKSFHFHGQIISSTMRYQFSRSLSSFIKFQYDSWDKRFGYDLLMLFEPAPVSRITLSIKNYSEDSFRFFHPRARTLSFKISYLFRI